MAKWDEDSWWKAGLSAAMLGMVHGRAKPAGRQGQPVKLTSSHLIKGREFLEALDRGSLAMPSAAVAPEASGAPLRYVFRHNRRGTALPNVVLKLPESVVKGNPDSFMGPTDMGTTTVTDLYDLLRHHRALFRNFPDVYEKAAPIPDELLTKRGVAPLGQILADERARRAFYGYFRNDPDQELLKTAPNTSWLPWKIDGELAPDYTYRPDEVPVVRGDELRPGVPVPDRVARIVRTYSPSDPGAGDPLGVWSHYGELKFTGDVPLAPVTEPGVVLVPTYTSTPAGMRYMQAELGRRGVRALAPHARLVGDPDAPPGSLDQTMFYVSRDRVGAEINELYGSLGNTFEDAKGGRAPDRFALSRNFLATDKTPDTLFGIPVVADRSQYTPEDLAFFRKHPEAGGYYDMGDEEEAPEEPPMQAAVGAGETMRGFEPYVKRDSNGVLSSAFGVPVRRSLYPGEDTFFKGRKDVAGMAAEDGAVILNPYSANPSENQELVAVLEAARHHMKRMGDAMPTFTLTPGQRRFFSTINNGRPYGSDEDIRHTILSRIIVGDKSVGDVTKAQREAAGMVYRYMKDHAWTWKTYRWNPEAPGGQEVDPKNIKGTGKAFDEADRAVLPADQREAFEAWMDELADPKSEWTTDDGRKVKVSSRLVPKDWRTDKKYDRDYDYVRAFLLAKQDPELKQYMLGPVYHADEGKYWLHINDVGKLPNHPTFSKGSYYAQDPKYSDLAGDWEGETYLPGKAERAVRQDDKGGKTKRKIPPIVKGPLHYGPPPPPPRGKYPGIANNPGNVEKHERRSDKTLFKGEIAGGVRPKRFANFSDPVDGLVAAATVLSRRAAGLAAKGLPFTIENYVPGYAPKSENDVEGYIGNLSKYSGFARDAVLDTGNADDMAKLLRNVVRFESGVPNSEWFTDDEYRRAALAMQEGASGR